MTKFLYILCIFGVLFWKKEEARVDREPYSNIKSWYGDQKGEPLAFYPAEQDSMLEDFTVLQIMLIRHGRPRVDPHGWFGYRAACNYIITYDTVGVHPFQEAPVILGPGERVVIYSSALPRAEDTAFRIFGSDSEIQVDSMFIEFQREIIPLPLVLPIKGWSSLSRFFWMLGLHSSNIPGFRDEKSRAEDIAVFLGQSAAEDKKVILVAHGFLNKYLVRYLKKYGWDHSYDGGNDYLSVQVLTKIIPE